MKSEDLFEKVTADLIAAIEDGAKDWRMPWHRLDQLRTFLTATQHLWLYPALQLAATTGI